MNNFNSNFKKSWDKYKQLIIEEYYINNIAAGIVWKYYILLDILKLFKRNFLLFNLR